MIFTPVNLYGVNGGDEYLPELNNIAAKVENEFEDYYTNFKEFRQNPAYAMYWNKCLSALRDTELFSHIIFCNDLFGIPPVKTFLTFYKDDFVTMTGDEKAMLDVYVKKSIGAVWGMTFKFALGYTEQKSVSVSMNDYFGVKTASAYAGRPKK
ncbi:MAG: hypothetical protein LBS21_00490 [Clostridiales bacterium]|jgi:hypothetical protein|nr:hypothetical protein [Clostridiales bacterium]